MKAATTMIEMKVETIIIGTKIVYIYIYIYIYIYNNWREKNDSDL